MTDKDREVRVWRSAGLLSDFVHSAKPPKTLAISPSGRGQRYPHPCPEQYPYPGNQSSDVSADLLGPPLTIREVARMFGCSAWTVRQRLIPLGLPYFRLTPNGKLMFFHNQIVRWVIERQRQKGAML